MTEKNFRDFVFTNPVTLYAGLNRDFFIFKGTVVENAAAKRLAQGAEEERRRDQEARVCRWQEKIGGCCSTP